MRRRAQSAPGPAYIYLLIDPRDRAVRYVGKTVNPSARLDQHLSDMWCSIRRPLDQKTTWLNELLMLNLQPIMAIVAITSQAEAGAWEARAIYAGLRVGWRLTNRLVCVQRKFRGGQD